MKRKINDTMIFRNIMKRPMVDLVWTLISQVCVSVKQSYHNVLYLYLNKNLTALCINFWYLNNVIDIFNLIIGRVLKSVNIR